MRLAKPRGHFSASSLLCCSNPRRRGSGCALQIAASTCPSRGPSAISAAPDHGFYVRRMPEMGGAAAAALQSCTPATVISSPAASAVAWPMHLKVRTRAIEVFGGSGRSACGWVPGRASSTPSRASRQGCTGGSTVAGLTGQNKNRSVG